MEYKSALFKNVRVPARLVMLSIVLAIVGAFWQSAILLPAALVAFILAVVLVVRVVRKDIDTQSTTEEEVEEDEENLVPLKVVSSSMSSSSRSSTTTTPAEQEWKETEFTRVLGGKEVGLAIANKGKQFSMRGWGLTAKEIQPHKEIYFEWLNNCMAEYCADENVDLYVRIGLNKATGHYIYSISTTPIHEIAPGVTVHGTSW